jgi:hypothetical protein
MSTRVLHDQQRSGMRVTLVARGSLELGSASNSTTIPIVRPAKWSGEGSAV